VGRETHREDLGTTGSTTSTEPIEERTTRHGVGESLEPREESHDVALDRPVVLVRVRRVRTLG
jgi:hypothetical protein